MHFNLQNDQLRVTIASWGAELVSLKDRENNLEYIWQANPDVWGRHAPILFPIVGRLNEDTLNYGDRQYEMKQHGFARDSEFSCLEQHQDRLLLRLMANGNTKSKFPFDFALTIGYQLMGNQLQVMYQVSNPQKDPLYFSIGSHPGFTCPVLPNTNFEDYELQWAEPENLERVYLEGGVRSERTSKLLDNSDRLSLSHELFEEDALIVQGAKSDYITLAHKSKGAVLSMVFPNYPYLGIWTKPDPKAEFICIEPWQGIADHQDKAGDFSEKEGVIKLNGGESFNCGYRIEIHPQTLG